MQSGRRCRLARPRRAPFPRTTPSACGSAITSQCPRAAARRRPSGTRWDCTPLRGPHRGEQEHGDADHQNERRREPLRSATCLTSCCSFMSRSFELVDASRSECRSSRPIFVAERESVIHADVHGLVNTFRILDRELVFEVVQRRASKALDDVQLIAVEPAVADPGASCSMEMESMTSVSLLPNARSHRR